MGCRRPSSLGRCVALALALASACRDMDQVERSFAHGSDPAIQTLVEAGRIPPDLIPARATRIREVHDLDTNEVWVAFCPPPGELQDMSQWKPVDGHSLGPIGSCDSISWWPADLVNGCKERRQPTGWSLYARGNERVASNVDLAEIFYWRWP
jgi:hypothetical protein